jgi:hypothetical protein
MCRVVLGSSCGTAKAKCTWVKYLQWAVHHPNQDPFIVHVDALSLFWRRMMTGKVAVLDFVATLLLRLTSNTDDTATAINAEAGMYI